MIRRLALCILVALLTAGPVQAGATLVADGDSLIECIDKKAGPEGEYPPPSPLLDQIRKDMQGGTPACIGLIYDACLKAGADSDACNKRESLAWLDAARLRDPQRHAPANRATYRAAVAAIPAQATRLCKAAAAISAWGANQIAAHLPFQFDLTHPCVREAIAQQVIVILVQSRGA